MGTIEGGLVRDAALHHRMAWHGMASTEVCITHPWQLSCRLGEFDSRVLHVFCPDCHPVLLVRFWVFRPPLARNIEPDIKTYQHTEYLLYPSHTPSAWCLSVDARNGGCN